MVGLCQIGELPTAEFDLKVFGELLQVQRALL